MTGMKGLLLTNELLVRKRIRDYECGGGMMKVILVNGSPHENGCTYTALSEIANTFAKEDIRPDIFWIGNKPLYSCVDCGKCWQRIWHGS